ncbi:MAG: RES domain-containing protein [Chloroflexi bacterium]|nr:RES domain-containing protein [Chloroflexota bacterium]
MLYRLFPWDPSAAAASPGGPLFNPRLQQGSGRHDNPALYGALYTGRLEVSAVAEWLAGFRGQRLGPDDFGRTDGRRWALVGLDDGALRGLVDLDDPGELVLRHLRPSGVATRTRSSTREVAGALFAEGIPGFGWWSTLEASWPNVTLFAERVVNVIRVADGPREIGIEDPVVRAAAAAIGVTLT